MKKHTRKLKIQPLSLVIFLISAMVVILSIIFLINNQSFTNSHLDSKLKITECEIKNDNDIPIVGKTYTSQNGYTISYPLEWFAATDPGVGEGDIFYQDEQFLNVRKGLKPPVPNPVYVSIMRFSPEALNITSADSVNEVSTIITKGAKTICEDKESISSGKILLKIIQFGDLYSVNATILGNNTIYFVSSPLRDLKDLERLKIFNQIVSSFKLTSNVSNK